jgi:hypothetical protein
VDPDHRTSYRVRGADRNAVRGQHKRVIAPACFSGESADGMELAS